MNDRLPTRPPYLDWGLDIWKMGLLAVLFGGLRAWTLRATP